MRCTPAGIWERNQTTESEGLVRKEEGIPLVPYSAAHISRVLIVLLRFTGITMENSESAFVSQRTSGVMMGSGLTRGSHMMTLFAPALGEFSKTLWRKFNDDFKLHVDVKSLSFGGSRWIELRP